MTPSKMSEPRTASAADEKLKLLIKNPKTPLWQVTVIHLALAAPSVEAAKLLRELADLFAARVTEGSQTPPIYKEA